MTNTPMTASEYRNKREEVLNNWVGMLRASEGYYPYMYCDSKGYPTIGMGSCINNGVNLKDIPMYKMKDPKKGFSPDNIGRPLTEQEKADYLAALKQAGGSYKTGKAKAMEMGIYGVTEQDARRLAVNENRQKYDQLYKTLYAKRGIDISKLDPGSAMVVMDLAYQVGSAGILKAKYDKLFEKIKTKGGLNGLSDAELAGLLPVNEGVNKKTGKPIVNIGRRNARVALLKQDRANQNGDMEEFQRAVATTAGLKIRSPYATGREIPRSQTTGMAGQNSGSGLKGTVASNGTVVKPMTRAERRKAAAEKRARNARRDWKDGRERH